MELMLTLLAAFLLPMVMVGLPVAILLVEDLISSR